MEFGTIEREIYVEASPEVVFEVVSSPDHVQQWWPDEAHYDAVPGSTGEIVFGAHGDDGRAVVQFTVIEAQPPRTVADLQATLAKATAAGVETLVPPQTSGGRQSAMVRFPGGYIAEIHAPAAR